MWQAAKKPAGRFAAAGSRCDQPGGLIDIYLTLAELCGVVPLFREPKRSTGRAAVTMFDPDNALLRTKHRRYIRYADGFEELYDHREDPHEWKNLANNPECAEIKAKQAKRLPKMNVPLCPGTLRTKRKS